MYWILIYERLKARREELDQLFQFHVLDSMLIGGAALPYINVTSYLISTLFSRRLTLILCWAAPPRGAVSDRDLNLLRIYLRIPSW